MATEFVTGFDLKNGNTGVLTNASVYNGDYINNVVFGDKLGIDYQTTTKNTATTPHNWIVNTLIDNLELKAGYTYTITVKADRAFNVGGYVRLRDSADNDLAVSSSMSGKAENSFKYKPAQNYSGAKIVTAFGSNDVYTITTIIEGTSYNVINELETGLSVIGIPSWRLRSGTVLNSSNTNAVTAPVIKTSKNHIEIINNRPNTSGCIYEYYIATISEPINDLLENPSARLGYIEQMHPYYSLVKGKRYGFQFSVVEINPSTNEYNALTPADFEQYPLVIYEYDEIPVMYQPYMNNRLDTIKTLDADIGYSGDSFIFITDPHNIYNDYISPSLAKFVIENSSVKRLFYGGDYIDQPASKTEAMTQLNKAIDEGEVVPDAIFMRGNHDSNPYGTGQLTDSELYGILTRRIEKYIDTERHNYYYFDNISQKIRYFILDTGEEGTIDSVQTLWFKTHADELSADWNIVILSHMAIYIANGAERTDLQYAGVVSSISGALTDVVAKVCCWICGHCHVDLEDTSTFDFPIIAVTCDSSKQGTTHGDNRDEWTRNRGAFDVFHINTSAKTVTATRIGGGENNTVVSGNLSANDRTWTYS